MNTTSPLICNPTLDDDQHTDLSAITHNPTDFHQIYIKQANGTIITLDVELDYTINKIKSMLNIMLNVDVNTKLMLDNKILLNDYTLNDYGIENNYTLQLAGASNKSDPLAKLLTQHKLYNDLYQILHEKNVDVAMLQSDLTSNDIDQFCVEFEFDLKQKLRFKQLMRNIESTKQLKYQAKKQQEEIQHRKSLVADDKMTVILIGDMGSGKTSLMRRYCRGTFDPNLTSSIGVDSMINIETLSDNTNMEIKIWDTAGQERFQSVCRSYYKQGECVIICYDVSIENPFKDLVIWRKAIEEYGKDDVVVILVGCKNDLAINNKIYETNIATANRIIEEQEWKQFDAMDCECSAKTGHNINGAFKMAAELVLRTRDRDKEKEWSKKEYEHTLQQELIEKNKQIDEFKRKEKQRKRRERERFQQYKKQRDLERGQSRILLEKIQKQDKADSKGCCG